MRLEVEASHFNSTVPSNAYGSHGQSSSFIPPSSLPMGRQIAGANAATLQQKLLQQQVASFSRQPAPPTLSTAPQTTSGVYIFMFDIRFVYTR